MNVSKLSAIITPTQIISVVLISVAIGNVSLHGGVVVLLCQTPMCKTTLHEGIELLCNWLPRQHHCRRKYMSNIFICCLGNRLH